MRGEQLARQWRILRALESNRHGITVTDLADQEGCHARTVWRDLAALRQKAGLSQKDLAKLLKTSQQQISRLESPGYEGHSLSTLRRVAEVLHARVRIIFEPEENGVGTQVAETGPTYHTKRPVAKRAKKK